MKIQQPILHLLLTSTLIALGCNKDSELLTTPNYRTPSNILFTADNHLCMVNEEGKNLRILANGPSGSFVNWQAHSSLDGRLAVFSYWTGRGPASLILLDLATESKKNLTDDSLFHENPVFSPNGTNVIFLTAYGWMESIFSRNIDSWNLTQLTHGLYCYNPSYSKDGSNITFAINNGPDSQGVAIMKSNGQDIRLLGPGWNPQFSPDASRILFTGFYSAYEEGLYIMNADGSQKRFLSTIPWQTIPRFSPDGSRIVLSNFVGDNFDIFEMDIDSGRAINLTNTPSAEFEPSYSLDGTKIIYVLSDSSSSDRLMIMDVHGNNKKVLVSNLGRLRDPTF